MATGSAITGLFVALAGIPIVLLVCRRLHIDSLALGARLVLWVLWATVLMIAFVWQGRGLGSIGLGRTTAWSLAFGALVGVLVLPLFPVMQIALAKLGLGSPQEQKLAKIGNYSAGYRTFIVLTAAVVEETLYRAYPIEQLYQLTGTIWIGALLALLVFTAAHLSWGVGHLATVFLVGTVLTGLYLWQRDIVACIIAHAVIDGAGFLLLPALRSAAASGDTSVG